MLKDKLLKELNESQSTITFIPHVETSPWNLSSTYIGDFDVDAHDSQAYTKVKIDIMLKQKDGTSLYPIGNAEFCIINAHNYMEDTFIEIDDEDGYLSAVMDSIDYANHEENYTQYGFTEPYQPFIILNSLYIISSFRKRGIGSSLIHSINYIVNGMLNLYTRNVFWQAIPLEAKVNPYDKYEHLEKENSTLKDIEAVKDFSSSAATTRIILNEKNFYAYINNTSFI